jgi:hypothetical protein
MNTLDIQVSQEQRPWVRPQLSELDVSTQTKGGPVDFYTEYSFFFFQITNDDKGGS